MVKYVLKDRPAAVIVRKYLREKTWHSTFVISTYLLGRKFSSLFQFEWICKHFCYLAPANIIKKLKQSNQIASIQSTGMYTAACTKFNPPSSPWYAYHCFSLLLKTNKQLSPNHDNIDSIFQGWLNILLCSSSENYVLIISLRKRWLLNISLIYKLGSWNSGGP